MANKENIKEMRVRHKLEIEELQKNCTHEVLSDCMPYCWAPGHMSHCVIVCENCGIEMKTTYKGQMSFNDDGEMCFVNETSIDKLFKCPERPNCFTRQNG